MTDKELLELAAKGAGYTLTEFWNPLTYNGDAFLLAVKLRMSVHIDDNLTDVDGIVTVAHIGDPYAATRRAIVLAAAKIGESL